MKKLTNIIDMTELWDCLSVSMETRLNHPPEEVETFRKENGVYDGQEAMELLEQYKLMIYRHELLKPLLKDEVAAAA